MVCLICRGIAKEGYNKRRSRYATSENVAMMYCYGLPMTGVEKQTLSVRRQARHEAVARRMAYLSAKREEGEEKW